MSATAPSPAPEDLTSPQSWAEWFVGLPLKIILIVVISSIVLFLRRRGW